jgi:TRAP-type C4-dicarboxylate transport system permease small subunit
MGAIRFAIAYFEELVAGAFMVLMSLATFANVLSRYVFNNPIQWAEEFARYAFIWVVFAGAVVCTKRQRHIAIDALAQVVPPSAWPWIRLLADACTLGLALVIVHYGWKLTAAATQTTATLKVPQYVVYAVVPVSAALIFVHTLRDFVGHLRLAMRRKE